MVIEVNVNVIRELIMTRTSRLRKWELKIDGKRTNEDQRHWTHPVKTTNDGK